MGEEYIHERDGHENLDHGQPHTFRSMTTKRVSPRQSKLAPRRLHKVQASIAALLKWWRSLARQHRRHRPLPSRPAAQTRLVDMFRRCEFGPQKQHHLGSGSGVVSAMARACASSWISVSFAKPSRSRRSRLRGDPVYVARPQRDAAEPLRPQASTTVTDQAGETVVRSRSRIKL
jgi:hypothetical protein